MNKETFELINKVKNPYLKNALQTHGLANESFARKTFNYLKRNPEIVNSTESRMTIYTAEISPYLYSDNSFIMKSTNDANFASSGETKRLNDSAVGPTVTKGRFYGKSLINGANAPQKNVKVRKNTGHDWEIEYFHTDPDTVTRELTSEVPYEVRGELLRAHADVIMQNVANFTAVEWSQGTVGTASPAINPSVGDNQYVFTSGSSTRSSVIVNNTSDTVKVITKQDMLNIKKALQRQQVTNKGRMYFLPTVEQYDDLLNIPDFIDYEKQGRTSRLIKGEVGEILNITILEPRHREDWGANILYTYTALSSGTTTLTKVEDTADSAANMASAGIAWVDSLVLRAEGQAIVFPWMNSPVYLADVYAVEMRYGATKKRNDDKGVVMLIDNPF